MHRRDFLHPRQIALTAGQALGALARDPLREDTSPETSGEPAAALLRFSRRCMATGFEVVFPFGTPEATDRARQAFDLLDRLESQLTVYRDSSEVSHLNRLAPFQSVRVEPGLFALLRLAAEITEITGGAFDITAGALTKAWGFYRGPRRVPSDEEQCSALEKSGMRHVVLDPRSESIRFLRPGLEINLGSIGKGYALDRVASWLNSSLKPQCGDLIGGLPASGATGSVLGTRANQQVAASAVAARDARVPEYRNPWHPEVADGRQRPIDSGSVLLQGGSSSVYAKGSPTADGRGWPVDIKHPWQPDRYLARLWLRDRALGTSAATFQHLEHEGRKLGHVLDPRTGWPASGVASASVVAATAAEADALSTGFFVGGPELARVVCASRPDIGCVLLPEGDDAEVIVLNLGPEECASPSAVPDASRAIVPDRN